MTRFVIPRRSGATRSVRTTCDRPNTNAPSVVVSVISGRPGAARRAPRPHRRDTAAGCPIGGAGRAGRRDGGPMQRPVQAVVDHVADLAAVADGAREGRPGVELDGDLAGRAEDRPEVQPDELRVARRCVLEGRLGDDAARPGRRPACWTAGARSRATSCPPRRPAGGRADPRRRRASIPTTGTGRCPVERCRSAAEESARDAGDARRTRDPPRCRPRRTRGRDSASRLPSAGPSRGPSPRPGCAAAQGSSSPSP